MKDTTMSTVTRLDPRPDFFVEMTPSTYVSPEGLREGVPHETEVVQLISADGRFTIGTWRAEPYTEFVESYPGDEYSRVLQGRVTLLNADDGQSHRFGPGDALVIAAGWRGVYCVEETLVKQFAYYTTA
jgi:uncharacterized cupin superfamily protein